MSAFRPRTTKTGGLPTISFILQKPEDLGAELKIVVCAVTGVILSIEIQRGKEAMREARHSARIGCTAACTLRGVEQAEHI